MQVKTCANQFTELIGTNANRLHFIGNVPVGDTNSVSVEELRRCVALLFEENAHISASVQVL